MTDSGISAIGHGAAGRGRLAARRGRWLMAGWGIRIGHERIGLNPPATACPISGRADASANSVRGSAARVRPRAGMAEAAGSAELWLEGARAHRAHGALGGLQPTALVSRSSEGPRWAAGRFAAPARSQTGLSGRRDGRRAPLLNRSCLELRQRPAPRAERDTQMLTLVGYPPRCAAGRGWSWGYPCACAWPTVWPTPYRPSAIGHGRIGHGRSGGVRPVGQSATARCGSSCVRGPWPMRGVDVPTGHVRWVTDLRCDLPCCRSRASLASLAAATTR